VIFAELPLLGVLGGETGKHQRDADDADGIGPIGAVQERGLGSGDDRACVVRILMGDDSGAGEGLLELVLGTGGDMRLVGRRSRRSAILLSAPGRTRWPLAYHPI
jgi:hypothetical protein